METSSPLIDFVDAIKTTPPYHLHFQRRKGKADPRKFQHQFHHQKKENETVPQKFRSQCYLLAFNHHRNFKKNGSTLTLKFLLLCQNLGGGSTEAVKLTSILQPCNLTIAETLREIWCVIMSCNADMDNVNKISLEPRLVLLQWWPRPQERNSWKWPK